MLSNTFWAAMALFGGLATAGYPPDVVDKLAKDSMSKVKDWLAKNPQGECNLKTAIRRKEWSDLTKKERKEYISAVLCLQSKPSKMSAEAPGTKSRFDDYVVVHLQQTMRNHGSTFFLPWHRLYLWHYENALRTECGYTGYQPYWNWDRYAQDPINSPLFDGSDTSMSGNGVFVPHPGVGVPSAPPPFNMIPPAQGGGCVTTGPFRNMSVNIGPLAPTLKDIKPNPQPDGLGYNPRCLRRDLNRNSAAVTTANYTYSLITSNENMYWFQTVMEGQFDQGKWGVHAGGHHTVGGDPAGDFYVSPGDPVFWLHHAMIDRVWWIWQVQDLEKRLKDLSHTMTMNNSPPSRNGTLEDENNLGRLYGDVLTRDLMSTLGGMGGRLCYIYE
ncbi:hypothetical protein V8F06_013585 [Rhypophila decipiens]